MGRVAVIGDNGDRGRVGWWECGGDSFAAEGVMRRRWGGFGTSLSLSLTH